MPVKDQWRWLSVVAGYPDCVDDLARPDGVVPDLHGFSAVLLAVDHCPGICQNASDLRQCKRTETHQQTVGNVRFVAGGKQDGDKGPRWRRLFRLATR
jgi:hypothetical protein